MATDDATADDDAALLVAVGAAITDARTRARFSQRALAAEAGVNRSYLHAVEKGTTKPSVITLIRIARALNTTAADLLHGIT